jgi:hypothetical protein
MNKGDVIDLLSLIQIGDDRSIGETDVGFWHEMIGDLPKDLAALAIKAHFREQPGVLIEPGHVVKRVRAMRNDMLDREPDYHRTDYNKNGIEAEADWDGYPGDAIAAPDPAPYPRDWTPEQRLSAYWESVKVGAIPATTSGWSALLAQSENREKRVSEVKLAATTEGENW